MVITKVEYLYDRLIPIARCTWDTGSTELDLDTFNQDLADLGYVRIPTVINGNPIHSRTIENALNNNNCDYGTSAYLLKEWLKDHKQCLVKINVMWYDPTIRHWLINADCYDVALTLNN